MTANDGHVTGNTAADELTIDNTAPVVSNIALSPLPMVAGQAVSCSYTFADVDAQSDASVLRWFVDGVEQSATGSTLSGFVGGQTVRCEVTANDGVDNGNTIDVSGTVQNTAPVVSAITIT